MKKLLITLIVFCCFPLMAMNHYEMENKILKEKIPLTDSDKQALDIGELGVGRYLLGGVVGTYPGFGLGHAIQGRWTSKGWIFSAGQVGSMVLFVAGVDDCVVSSLNSGEEEDCTLFTAGVFGFMFFKIWEAIDVWWGGYTHRRDYKNLKNKVIGHKTKEKTSFFIRPINSFTKNGLSLGFRF